MHISSDDCEITVFLGDKNKQQKQQKFDKESQNSLPSMSDMMTCMVMNRK